MSRQMRNDKVIGGTSNNASAILYESADTSRSETNVEAELDRINTDLSALTAIKIITDTCTQSELRAGRTIPYPAGRNMSNMMVLNYKVTYNNGTIAMVGGSNASSSYQTHYVNLDSNGITIGDNNFTASSNSVTIDIAYIEL